MSFSLDVKEQIIKNIYKQENIGPTGDCCIWAEACGLLLFSQLLKEDARQYRTESEATAKYIAERIASAFCVYTELRVPNGNGCKKQYSVQIPDKSQRESIRGALADFAGCPRDDCYAEYAAAKKICGSECCRNAFVRGAFLAAGTISEPDKMYNLEILSPDRELLGITSEAMAGAEIKCAVSQRYGKGYLYIHDSGGLENALAMIGAHDAYFKLVNIKVLRDVRNKAQRQCNCDDANIKKTVNAAQIQTAAINKIIRHGGLGLLPEELREIARLRLDNCDMSLKELGAAMEPPLSRSGANHRIQRILEFAEGIPDDEIDK